MVEKLPVGEGASINRPPLFYVVNYQFQNVRMNIFIHSTDKGIWESIENGSFVPQVKKDDVLVDKPSSEWTEAECKKAKFDLFENTFKTKSLSQI